MQNTRISVVGKVAKVALMLSLAAPLSIDTWTKRETALPASQEMDCLATQLRGTSHGGHFMS